MNTSRNPEMIPGRDRGNVTVQKVCHRLAPMLHAASSTDASMDDRMPDSVRYAMGKKLITCTTIRLPMPYTLFPVIPSSVFVMKPCLPNRKMMDRDRMKGGDRIGSVAMVCRNFRQGMLVRVTV